MRVMLVPLLIVVLVIGSAGCKLITPETLNIMSVTSRNITDTTVEIVWETNYPATSRVEYGKTDEHESSTPTDKTLNVNHSITLTGLVPNTAYNFRVRSIDNDGSIVASRNYVFTTQALPTPKLSATPTSAPEPAHFIISDLSVTPTDVAAGELVDISFTLTNNGGTEGNYNEVLTVKGTAYDGATMIWSSIDSINETLQPNETMNFYFSKARTVSGLYTVTIGGNIKQFTVAGPSPTPDAAQKG
ncbi:fibronectin type III domain-containing protein [Chloroflexota bacterium]